MTKIKFMTQKVFLLSLVFITQIAYGQSKYGADENACKENLSMFREYYKQKNYVDALKPWRWAFINCPASSGNIYKNGPKIIKAKMKSNPDNKDQYIDTLMMIYDQRIQYGFGDEGYILGLKGYELVLLSKDKSMQAYEILEKGISMSGVNSDFRSIYGFMKAVVNLEKSGKKVKEDVISVYATVSEIMDYNIVNESKTTKYFIQYSEKVEDLFTPYANCEDLINLFSDKFNADPENTSLLKRIIKVLEEKECTENELFFSASERLYELEPSPLSANKMSKMCITKGLFSNAVNFAQEAVDNEEDGDKKAIYYLTLADAYRASGRYNSARDAVNKTLDIKQGWGEAYMSLANIYLTGAKTCGSEFEQQTVYWLVIDQFRKALNDDKTKDRASKSINIYSKYFPNKETCFFNGVEEGKTYIVGCWINRNTIVRTSD